MITINLFSPTFWDCSTAFQTSEHVQYVHERMAFDGITLFTDGAVNSPVVDQVKSPVKIGWLHEPQCLQPEVYDQVFRNLGKFTQVLTYSQDLATQPEFSWSPYGGSWIPFDQWGLPEKTKNCSMLFGTKRATLGHQMRHAVAEAMGDYYGVDYYGARGTPTTYGAHTKLLVLKDYRFSIVTETCCEDLLFTEILLDCFALGTVPIFWGCPNIGRVFNPDGILNFERVKDLSVIMPQLSEGFYKSMSRAIWENQQIAKEYAVCEDWQWEHIYKEYLL